MRRIKQSNRRKKVFLFATLSLLMFMPFSLEGGGAGIFWSNHLGPGVAQAGTDGPAFTAAGLRISTDRIERSPEISSRRQPASAALGSDRSLAAEEGASSYEYEVTAIEPLEGSTGSKCFGINNAGEVVGRSFTSNAATGADENRRAFIWSRSQGIKALPTLSGESGAWGINDSGFASGYAYTAEVKQHAVRWDSRAMTIVDIGTLKNTTTNVSGDTSSAYNINNAGKVVGQSDIPNDDGSFVPFHAFLYDDQAGIQDLGTLTTASPYYQNGYSIVYDINSNDGAVGIADDSSWAFRPIRYSKSSGMQALQTDLAYPPGGAIEWYAVVINNSGLIGGHVIAATNQSLPYYWQNETAAPVRITMPAGFPYGEIYGINASGQMVGIMWDSAGSDAVEHAFLYDTEHGVRDLNDLIDPQSGWTLFFAHDINDARQIVGAGELNGQKRGFVLSPRQVGQNVLFFPVKNPRTGKTAVIYLE